MPESKVIRLIGPVLEKSLAPSRPYEMLVMLNDLVRVNGFQFTEEVRCSIQRLNNEYYGVLDVDLRYATAHTLSFVGFRFYDQISYWRKLLIECWPSAEKIERSVDRRGRASASLWSCRACTLENEDNVCELPAESCAKVAWEAVDHVCVCGVWVGICLCCLWYQSFHDRCSSILFPARA
jgi:hypothetical protein